MYKRISISLIVLVILSAVAVEEEKLEYALSLAYGGTSLTNAGQKLISSTPPDSLNQPEKGFTVKIVNFNGQVLSSFKFSLETMIIAAPPRDIFSEDGTQIAFPEEPPLVLKEVVTTLVIPYFSSAKSIEIYDENNKLMLSVDVSKYSKQASGNAYQKYWLIGALAVAAIACGIFLLTRKKKTKDLTEKTEHKEIKKETKAEASKEEKKSEKKVKKEEPKKAGFCGKCGHKIRGVENFCPKCGNKIYGAKL